MSGVPDRDCAWLLECLEGDSRDSHACATSPKAGRTFAIFAAPAFRTLSSRTAKIISTMIFTPLARWVVYEVLNVSSVCSSRTLDT